MPHLQADITNSCKLPACNCQHLWVSENPNYPSKVATIAKMKRAVLVHTCALQTSKPLAAWIRGATVCPFLSSRFPKLYCLKRTNHNQFSTVRK